MLFVVAGSGNEGHGANQLWVYKRLHEPAWLLGVLAGRLTRTDTLGVVGTVAVDDVNDQINAFIEGVRHARRAATVQVAFIDAWSGEAKAAAATRAQTKAGADIVFQLAPAYGECERFGILCFGAYVDDHARAPEAVLSSAVALWDRDLARLDAIWRDGPPYDGDRAPRWFSMAEGGATLASYHGLAEMVPQAVTEEIARLAARIRSGEMIIPIDVSDPRR